MTDTTMKPVHIINVPLDLGASRRGTDAGPSAFRIAGLSKAVTKLGYSLTAETCRYFLLFSFDVVSLT